MLQRDYLVRLVKQAVRFLQLLAGVIKLRDYPEALRLLDEGFRQFFGLSSAFINTVPLATLRDFLSVEGVLDGDRALLMAALLDKEGEVYEGKGEEAKAFHRFHRVLQLRLLVWESERPTAVPTEWGSIEELVERLAPFHLPPDTQRHLLAYHEAAGQFAATENLLWEWLSATEWAAEPVAHGLALYERLLALPDAILEAGGLPRAEVEAGHAELLATRPAPDEEAP